MMPIGPLMVEHRWIERVISNLQGRLEEHPSRRAIDSAYVDRLVDFLRTYADRCHHGKEEDILFRDLNAKRLDPTLAEIMRQLTEEHQWARAKTKQLVGKLTDLGVDNVLIVTDEVDPNLYLSARNLFAVGVVDAKALDPVSLIRHEKVLMTVPAIKQIEEMLA